MITKAFKYLLSMVLMANSTRNGMMEVKEVGGNKRYIANPSNSGFPAYTDTYIQITAGIGNGFWFGRSSTAPTEDDYRLNDRITSGLTGTTPTKTVNHDSSGNPYIQYTTTLTNSSDSPITVAEIGFVQNVRCSQNKDSSSLIDSSFLLDHTVLSTPVTIAAGGSATITYTLKAVF